MCTNCLLQDSKMEMTLITNVVVLLLTDGMFWLPLIAFNLKKNQCKYDTFIFLVLLLSNYVSIPFRHLRFGEHDLNSTIDCDDVGKCNPEPFTRKPEKIIVHEEYDFVKNGGANPNDIGKKW